MTENQFLLARIKRSKKMYGKMVEMLDDDDVLSANDVLDSALDSVAVFATGMIRQGLDAGLGSKEVLMENMKAYLEVLVRQLTDLWDIMDFDDPKDIKEKLEMMTVHRGMNLWKSWSQSTDKKDEEDGL